MDNIQEKNCSNGTKSLVTNLRYSLPVLPTIQRRPRDTTRVFALEEEALGFAPLKPEDLAVTSHVQLSLESDGLR
jgi:hypothetical protein